jgi:hypothetical protein
MKSSPWVIWDIILESGKIAVFAMGGLPKLGSYRITLG